MDGERSGTQSRRRDAGDDLTWAAARYGPQHIVAPSQAADWRADLLARGMEHALDRGLVAYEFQDEVGVIVATGWIHVESDYLFVD
jgi:hypothetical protein